MTKNYPLEFIIGVSLMTLATTTALEELLVQINDGEMRGEEV